jgi:flagellar biosynthetic protein FliP
VIHGAAAQPADVLGRVRGRVLGRAPLHVPGRLLRVAVLAVLAAGALLLAGAATGHAVEVPRTLHQIGTAVPATPVEPTPPVVPGEVGDGGLTLEINAPDDAPSSAVVTLIGITLLSVAPALLLMMTSFTKIFVVLAMTRNALGLASIPPNQVLAGLALFLSLFIMSPVLAHVNTLAVQPYLNGDLDFGQALTSAAGPLSNFMLAHTREEDIALMTRAAGIENPATPEATPLQTLIPAFMISELRSAFIIGFVIFIPFLIIDLVVAAALMSMGMMMLPPVMISLPFKILLFILVDGWGLIITSLIRSYHGVPT